MGNAIPPIQRLREELHYECMHVLYCKYCATRGVCIGDAHGPGRSQGNIGMRGAKKCGRLCCLSPSEVKLSSQVLRLTQTLRQAQPLLIAMCLHVAPCVVHSRPWRSCLGWRLRVYCLGKQTCEEELLHRDPLSWLRWCVVHESRQDLCHGSPYLINTTRFRNPRLTTLLDKKHAFGTQSIAGEKNHPLTEGGQLPLEQPVQGLPIECWHQ